jgi:hypothetical protein
MNVGQCAGGMFDLDPTGLKLALADIHGGRARRFGVIAAGDRSLAANRA